MGMHTDCPWPRTKDCNPGRIATKSGEAHLVSINRGLASIVLHLQPSERFLLVLQAKVAGKWRISRQSKEAKGTKAILCDYKHNILADIKVLMIPPQKVPCQERTQGPNPLCWPLQPRNLHQGSKPWQGVAAVRVGVGCRSWEWDSPLTQELRQPGLAGGMEDQTCCHPLWLPRVTEMTMDIWLVMDTRM